MELKELYDVKTFLPVNLALSVDDYSTIKKAFSNEGANGCLRAYIINCLPIKSIPSQYQEQAFIINDFLKSREFLNTIIETDGVHPIFGTPIKEQITLYDLIIKHNKFPAHKYISTEQIDIPSEIEKFHKSWALNRFFINQGKVFYSEALESISKLPQFTPYNAHSLKNYYPLLLQQNILRQANENDLPDILRFKTKKQLIDVLIKLNCFDLPKIKKLQSSSKPQIIEVIKDKDEIRNIELQNYFYFLSEPYQQYKEWIVLQEVYYRVYDLFDSEVDFFWLSLHTIMKDLMKINNDYETAYKLGKLFYKHLKDFEKNSVYHAEWEIPRIETQMNKIKKNL